MMKGLFLFLAVAASETSFLINWPAENGNPAEFGFDDYYAVDDEHFHVFASGDEIGSLRGNSFPKPPSIEEKSRPAYAKFANDTFPGRSLREMGYHASSGAPPPGYLDRFQINEFMDQIVDTYPTLAEIFDLTPYGPLTHEGRLINMIKISDNVDQDEDEDNIIIVAAHHCRELVTPQIVLNIIQQLTSQYGTNAEITSIVDNNQIYLVPVVNVDGYDYVFTVDDFWRKNRKNGHGVDINRNYDLGWDGPAGGSTNPDSNTYRGLFPLSEEESTVLINFERERNTAKILDFHSSGREVLPAYRSAPISEEIYDYNWAVGTELANLANYATRTPSADGEHQQQGIKEITTFGWLVETSNQFQPPFSEALAEVERVFPLALRFLSYPIPLWGHVRSSTGTPVQAIISVDGIIGPGTDHSRQADSRFGRFHIFLAPGTYQVTFSANNHVSETQSVTITGEPSHLEITLQAINSS